VRAAAGSVNPAAVLFRGAALPALAGAVVLAAAATLADLPAATSVLVGAAMAIVALTVVPVLHQFCRTLEPSLVLGIAVLAYCLVIGLLWVAYSLVIDASWLSGGWAGSGVLVVVVGWAVGHMRAALRLRQPLYEDGVPTAGR
jgi:hypothetical protein